MDKHTNLVETSFLGACQLKKSFGVLFLFLIIYVIYFDLTVGTLPHLNSSKVVEALAKPNTNSEINVPYFEAKVEPGDTLLTIVEHRIKKPLPVSIENLIHDFENLNPEQSTEKIQIGRTYRFPDYTK